MSEKLDAAFGAEAADYIRQLQAENERLRVLLFTLRTECDCELTYEACRRALEEKT